MSGYDRRNECSVAPPGVSEEGPALYSDPRGNAAAQDDLMCMPGEASTLDLAEHSMTGEQSGPLMSEDPLAASPVPAGAAECPMEDIVSAVDAANDTVGFQTDDVAGGAGALFEWQGFLRELYQQADAGVGREAEYMLSSGVPEEEVARWTVAARNAAKEEIRRGDAFRAVAEARNTATYGNPVGPSYEQLRHGDEAFGMRPRSNAEIIEGAARSNGRVNRWAGRLRIAGRILLLIDIAVSGYRVYMAEPEDRPRVFAREVGGLAGAAAGGWAGAEIGGYIGAGIGAWFGGAGAVPGAAIGAFIGGVGGAIGGSMAGNAAGEWIIDELYPVEETRFEAN